MKNALLFIGILLLIAFEFLRVYLIMPLPGSQRMNSIGIAYWLGSNQTIIRIIGGLLIAYPMWNTLKQGTKSNKLLLSLLLVAYGVVAYLFQFQDGS